MASSTSQRQPLNLPLKCIFHSLAVLVTCRALRVTERMASSHRGSSAAADTQAAQPPPAPGFHSSAALTLAPFLSFEKKKKKKDAILLLPTTLNSPSLLKAKPWKKYGYKEMSSKFKGTALAAAQAYSWDTYHRIILNVLTQE